MKLLKTVAKSVLVSVGLESILVDRRHQWLTRSRFSELSLVYRFFMRRGGAATMIDVGAHFGESSLPFLHKRWTVHAFEPDSSSAKQRALGRLAKQFDRLSVSPKAVADVSGDEVDFFVSDESTGISSLVPFSSRHHATDAVSTVALRDYIPANEIEDVAFLKIDTEGYDFAVLKGFPFEEIKPIIVLCEFEDTKTELLGYGYRDIGDFLCGLGYKVYLSEWYPVTSYGSLHSWRSLRRYPCDLADCDGWGNFLAVIPSEVGNFERLAYQFIGEL